MTSGSYLGGSEDGGEVVEEVMEMEVMVVSYGDGGDRGGGDGHNYEPFHGSRHCT